MTKAKRARAAALLAATPLWLGSTGVEAFVQQRPAASGGQRRGRIRHQPPQQQQQRRLPTPSCPRHPSADTASRTRTTEDSRGRTNISGLGVASGASIPGGPFFSSAVFDGDPPIGSGDGGYGGGDARTKTKARTPKAPLVDSSLLRFLSAQKRGAAVIDIEEVTANGSVSDDKAAVAETALLSQINSVALEEDRISGGQDAAAPAAAVAAATDSATSGAPVLEPTMASSAAAHDGQYNAQRVAQDLVDVYGAEEASATEAGRVVQQHALDRAMRRNVQRFLRERDEVWSASAEFTGATTNGVLRDASEVQRVETISNSNASEQTQRSRGLAAVLEELAEAGLTGKDIAAILTHTPSVAFMSASDTLRPILERTFALLSDTLKLRKYDARKVLRTCPGLLTGHGSKSAEEVVTLMSSLGVSAKSLGRDKVALPRLLSRSPAAIFRLAVFLSGRTVRMRPENVGALIRKPACADLLDAVAPVEPLNRVETSEIMADLDPISLLANNDDCAQAQALLRRQRVDDAYRTMTETAATLCRNVGVQNLDSMIAASPGVLLLDMSQFTSVVDFLTEVGVHEDDVPIIMQSYPALIEADLANLEQTVEYLRSLGVQDDSLGGIFRAFPSLLLLDVETDMMPVVSFLKELGVVNIGRFITRLPPVLGYSVEKELKPKWEYLSLVCKFDYFEVVRFPAYFSYPLERVIKTRYEYLRDHKKAPISLVSVDDVLRFGDVDFAVSIAGDRDGGEEFLRYTKQRKKVLASGGKKKKNKRRTTGRRPGQKKTSDDNHRSSVDSNAKI